MSESASLDDLVRGAQKGGQGDLDDLMTTLRPMICRWAVVWSGSPDIAEDVAQKVLLRVHDALPTYTSQGRFTTWVYSITRNALIDEGRARGREDALRDRLQLDKVAHAVVAESGASTLEAVDLLQHLMEVLSPQQRAALDLVDLQGFSALEAGEMLDIAPATVRVHVHRAREALRARIEGAESEGAAHD